MPGNFGLSHIPFLGFGYSLQVLCIVVFFRLWLGEFPVVLTTCLHLSCVWTRPLTVDASNEQSENKNSFAIILSSLSSSVIITTRDHQRLHQYARTCMYACMHAYIYNMHAFMYTCLRACTHRCMHARMHACMQVCMHAWMPHHHQQHCQRSC